MRLRRRAVEPIDILVVCTGNLCRSPIIETLLKAELPHLHIESRGTHAPVGEPWHPLALQVLAERGHVVSGQAQQLTARDVRAATLILTAEGWHRAEVVRLDPTAENRAFALLEAARLLRDAPLVPTDVRGLTTALAHRLRAQRTEHDDDFADPFGSTIDVFRSHATEAAAAAADIVRIAARRK